MKSKNGLELMELGFINKIKTLKEDNSGQVLILFALLLVVLLGFATLAIDVGYMTYQKTYLQTATDAAALAGASEIPDSVTDTEVTNVVDEYANLNNPYPEKPLTIITNIDRTENTVEVILTQGTTKYFARIINKNDYSITAHAKAKCVAQWAGEALPFINLDDDYGTNPEVVAWEKVTPGDFESIDNYEIINPSDHDKLYFKIDYMNGVELKKGTVATIKQEVGYVYDQHKPDKPVYLISLNRDVMIRGTVKLINGSYRSLSKLKNNDVVDPSQLVLLECIFHDYDSGKTLFLTVLDVYDIANNEFPPDYVSPDGSPSRLIE